MTYLDALQDALAAEHAAVYLTGVLGAQTSASTSPDLFAALTATYTDHRGARDLLVDLVRAADGDPVVAESAYALPSDLSDVAVIEQQALAVQRSVAAAYAALVASSAGRERRWPIQRLQVLAVRDLAFGGRPVMFPGSEEYAER